MADTRRSYRNLQFSAPLTDKPSRSEKEDTPKDDNKTSTTPPPPGKVHRKKYATALNGQKMKIEKAGEHHSKRSRSLPRRGPSKSGKP